MTCGCSRPKDEALVSSVKPCSECLELKGSGGSPSVLQPIRASDLRTLQSVIPVTSVGDTIQARGLSMSTSLTTYATPYRPSGSPGMIVTSGIPVLPSGTATGILATGVVPTGYVEGEQLPCYCGPDVTQWFVDELNTHKEFVKSVHDDSPLDTEGSFTLLIKFRIYAGTIPYKWCNFTTANCPTCSKCADTVMLCGTCISKTELGGIMFGAMSQVAGIPVNTAIGAAVWKGITTTRADMAGDLSGVNIGKAMDKDLTAEGLCKILTNPMISKAELDALRAQFSKDSNTARVLEHLTTNLLGEMTVAGCGRCPAPSRTLGHSNFSGQSVRFSKATYDYADIYSQLMVDWPENPFSKK
jgi:hypothetical protein